MKLLVTGGAGFIGSHLVDKLIDLEHEVAVVDNLKTGKKENVNPKASFFEVDIIDKENLGKVFNDFKPEIVFHLAAQNEVPYSMDHPFEDARVNILGTMNVLESSKVVGVKKIIYSNTGGAFYGDVEKGDLPIKEDQIINKPTSFYGVSKLSAEYYLKLFSNLYEIIGISLRYSNVYGPRQQGNKEAGVVAIFTQNLLKGKKPVVFGDGTNTRDYIFVSDVVDANIKALDFNQTNYFNISTGVRTSVMEVFYAIEENLKSGLQPELAPPRKGDPSHNSLDPKKAKDILNWEPKVGFKEGIKKTTDYYKAEG